MGALAGTVLLLVLFWLARLVLYPYRTCPRCNGSSRRPGSTRAAFGICGKCGGDGVTLRPAARWVRGYRGD